MVIEAFVNIEPPVAPSPTHSLRRLVARFVCHSLIAGLVNTFHCKTCTNFRLSNSTQGVDSRTSWTLCRSDLFT